MLGRKDLTGRAERSERFVGGAARQWRVSIQGRDEKVGELVMSVMMLEA